MADYQLVDSFGRPVHRGALTEEVAAATVGGVRSPIAGYPADGLTPLSLANILRDADTGNPLRYLELAETIEERDAHYVGVLGTRRRSVSQIEITVDAASDDAADEAIAQEIRDWIKRDELTEEIFDILDCIGKGYSFTEIIWDTSSGQWLPLRLEWRDPRWFRFDRNDLRTPMLIGQGGQDQPLEPFKFIQAQIKAKSGLALRSGIARIAAWGWMFKMFTQRDWAIFSQTYGQPVRLGKFGAGASEDDKRTLFRAVANIAGDCAAIIPESMQIEFVEAANVGASHQLYKERADWLDQQLSKAVLGQTATTDAVVGGLGSGKEHRAVQKDIQTADARALSAILNRDLVRPFVQLNHGPQKAYPRLRIEEVEREDVASLSQALVPFIDRGLQVSQGAILSKFGLPEAKPSDRLLGPVAPSAPGPVPQDQNSSFKGAGAVFKRVEPFPGMEAAPQAAEAPGAGSAEPADLGRMADQLDAETTPSIGRILKRLSELIAAASSLDELRALALAAFPDLPDDDLVDVLAMGLGAAELKGRADVANPEGAA